MGKYKSFWSPIEDKQIALICELDNRIFIGCWYSDWKTTKI